MASRGTRCACGGHKGGVGHLLWAQWFGPACILIGIGLAWMIVVGIAHHIIGILIFLGGSAVAVTAFWGLYRLLTSGMSKDL